MKLLSIASGSSGNCIYVGNENTHILIDDGISRKKVIDGLKTIDVDINDISAILITHEHSDHVSGLGVLLRKNNIPVYATKGTIEEIKDMILHGKLGSKFEPDFIEIKRDEEFYIDNICIKPITISHDAKEPCAYTLEADGKKCGVVTDLGYYDEYIVDCFQNMDAFLIESNYDISMLEVGPYTYELKRRILGKNGHLSNVDSGRLLSKLLNPKVKGVYLGHMSKENNHPNVAYETVRYEVNSAQNDCNFDDYYVVIADRYMPSPCIEF